MRERFHIGVYVASLIGLPIVWLGLLGRPRYRDHRLPDPSIGRAKPSYLICLLPALGLVSLQRVLSRRSIDWQLLLLGVGVPAVAILLWQFGRAFTWASSDGSQIIFAPFAMMSLYSSSLFPKFVLSIAFPVAVYALYFTECRGRLALSLAWMVFGVSALYMYFLAESGDRFTHGNFTWGAQVSLLILFIVSAAVFVGANAATLLRDGANRPSWRFNAVALVLGLHLVSGVFQYYIQVTRDVQKWW